MKDTQIIRKREGNGGVDAYGLYLDVVVYNTIAGSFVRQERFFLADRLLCHYSRPHGKKRAAWRPKMFPNGDAAVAWIEAHLKTVEESDRLGIEMQARPYIVELTGSDVESIKKGEPPYARFAGTVATEKVAGKVEDDWKPNPAAF